ncbi:leucine-rich repeat-containing protein 42 [Trichomycterus rosablanca]|uniref:leucine-rich repeat-containing protein 42 n=1 Tax=Trichomycterus rosablanca TaxID=2290929 RepID=UPI002F360809
MFWDEGCDFGRVYVREEGALRCVNTPAQGENRNRKNRFLWRDVNQEKLIQTDSGNLENRFICSYNSAGDLRYTPRPLLDISIDFIAGNIEHVESLVGFPEQMAERFFRCAEQKQKFLDPGCSVRSLQVFSESYGGLVLRSLCLRERCLLLSERWEEIQVFHGLETLDLQGCRLGDGHNLFTHLTSDACSRLVRLFLGENRLSDEGLQRLTAPVRVMRRGLENLQHLDLSSNPLTERGLRYLTCFQKLRELNISDTNVKLDASLEAFFRRKMAMVLSVSPLQTFSHSRCGTEGWAEQVINQWELKAAEAPKKIQIPKTNALRFYGREKFVKENVHAASNHPVTEEKKTSPILHFHKPDHHTSSRREEPGTNPHSHQNVSTSTKRKLGTRHEDDVDPGPPTKRGVALSAQDLELLNSY